MLSTAETIKKFRRFNRCQKAGKKKAYPDRDKADGCRAGIERFEGGKEGAEVALLRIEGGGHTWPSGADYKALRFGNVYRDIDASALILDFFLRHRRKTETTQAL